MSNDGGNDNGLFASIKSFFNHKNSIIILGAACGTFFLSTLLLIIILVRLIKGKKLYKSQAAGKHHQDDFKLNSLVGSTHGVATDDLKTYRYQKPSNMGITSNQIGTANNMSTTAASIIQETSLKKVQTTSPLFPLIPPAPPLPPHEGGSFNNFEDELRRTWREKGILQQQQAQHQQNSNFLFNRLNHESNVAPSSITTMPHTEQEPPTSVGNDQEEVETVNEVLGMEERGGKIYYKVNFTGHPSDYTAWVCEEDLIPE
ncbi:unnamed protein product [Didymodactylos carnosus]|uniref:Chromo domain-containing protein n=1 Tax=Didymodactylos carnosus TaxID=1234261 RepID=A0A8S2LUV8_9BILA|nr:unnamed protein product [Didymodactylos carnosus]CAF3919912.1 unnamed protein product [Didymodactylos carnosus]